MIVMKFGGTSMGSAARMINSAGIILSRSAEDRTGVILSAVGGISNRLQNAVDEAVAYFAFQENKEDDDSDAGVFYDVDEHDEQPVPDSAAGDGVPAPEKIVKEIIHIHEGIIDELEKAVNGFRKGNVLEELRPLFSDLHRLVNAISTFGECPSTIYCRIMGMGERLCLPIAAEILRAKGENVQVLDIRDYIITEGNPLEGDPVISKITKAFAPLCGQDGPRVLLASGFIASDVSGDPSLLGRNGSDFSAALMAMGLKADKLEIWTDVDGIFTADPRIVPDAQLVEDISYEEAAELSFFGSKVLHPKTLGPLAVCGIETMSLNSFNPSARGTRISSADKIPPAPDTQPVRGVTVLKDVTVVSVSGIGLKGKSGTAARIFNAAGKSGVSVLLITQSSSEYTVTFCVKTGDSRRVKDALQEEFASEMREHLVNPVSTIKNTAIVSIVGDGMKERRGVAGKFFTSLAFAGINILAIAQGSSERSISAVIDGDLAEKAVRVVHSFLFNTMQRIEVFLFGTTGAGSRLLEQIRSQQKELLENRIDLRVCGISDLRRIVFFRSGVPLDSWRKELEVSDERSSVDSLLAYVRDEQPLNPVFVDCSMEEDDALDTSGKPGSPETEAPESAGEIAWHYPDIFSAGMNVVTLNTLANNLPYNFYLKMHKTASLNKKNFLYGSSVGAGLPVMEMLRNMVRTGDYLIRFEGITCDAFAYLFKEMEEGLSFSEAVKAAGKKGSLEGNPALILSPDVMRRNAVIIAREAGFPVELEDVEVEPLFPENFDASVAPEKFMEQLPVADEWFASKIKAAAAKGMKLRYASVIENTGVPGTGSCAGAGGKNSVSVKVGFFEVPPDAPLADIRCAESIFVFTTRYYSPFPLVLQGYGSNTETSAAGLFADILRTASW